MLYSYSGIIKDEGKEWIDRDRETDIQERSDIGRQTDKEINR